MTVRIAADKLQEFLQRIFIAAGCDVENASVTAEGVVEADLRGHRTQGTDHIYTIIRDLRAGHLNGKGRPFIARQTPASAQVDGDGSSGYVAGRFATDLAIRKARENGVAAIGVVRGGDIFMLGAYAERMARSGIAGMVLTNSLFRVHPPGGIDAVLGTNPIAFAIPMGDDDPVVVDFSSSATSVGHVRIASYTGEMIAMGLAIDRDGAPTTDAKEALKGALSPLGSYKGFGLGLAIALLSGPVIGAMVGKELKEAMEAHAEPPSRGHLFVALDPAAFGDISLQESRTKRLLAEIKTSRRAPGIEEILIPGERSRRMRKRSLKTGIELLDAVWEKTARLAEELGVPMVVP